MMNRLGEAADTSVAEKDEGYPSPGYAWYALSLICLAYVFAFIDRIIIGLLTPAIQADLGITDAQAGILQGLAFALFYTICGIPLGLLVDRANRKWILVAGVVTWSLATALGGLARSFAQLFVTRVGVGVGEATLNPAATSLIGDYFRPSMRPRAFGVYMMATAFATGVTYITGGLIITFATSLEDISIPMVGNVLAWQLVLIIVGLGGLIPAFLMATTMREPVRRGRAVDSQRSFTRQETFSFLRTNATTLACHHLGVALIIMAIYGWINWMPTYFLRIHEWQPSSFSYYYGIFGGLAGVFSALSSGYVTNWFQRRGYIDGTMRTVAVGGIGLAVFAGLAPLMPTPETALLMFVLAGLFANYPAAQALAAISDLAPNEVRGLITSIYIACIGIISSGFGPFIMGWVTDNVFADPMKIGYSMSLVTSTLGLAGVALVFFGLKSFRQSLRGNNVDSPNQV